MLVTEADYDDLELELEFRVHAGTGSGLFLRVDPNAPLSGAQNLEVQIIDDDFPKFAATPFLTGSVFGAFPRQANPRVKRGEWNTMRVRLENRNIQIWVNGTQTLQADLDSARDKFAQHPGLNRRSGRIGLQQNQRADVEFRNLRLKPLGRN